MRKPRVILFDDEKSVLDVLRDFFALRNYEVLAYSEPSICPVYSEGEPCTKPFPCGDLIITDYRMQRMNGVELLEAQASRGCKLTPQNKAVISGHLPESALDAVRRLGAAYLEKPFGFDELSSWVDECESRMNLSRRIAIRRKEERTVCCDEVRYQLGAGPDVRRGIMINRSGSGFCLKVDEPPGADRSVTLHLSLPPWTAPAIVRWLKTTADRAHLIGLQRY